MRRSVSNTNLESLDRPLVVLVLFAGAVVVFWTARAVQLLSLLLVDFAQPREVDGEGLVELALSEM